MGNLSMPKLFLVPVGMESRNPLIGTDLELVDKSRLSGVKKVRLNDSTTTPLSNFDLFFGDEDLNIDPAQPLADVYDAFFSHAWGRNSETHQSVMKIYGALKNRVQVWIDEEKMNGNVSAAMAAGIQRSNCVVVFITELYATKIAGKSPSGNKDNCFLEFDYASR